MDEPRYEGGRTHTDLQGRPAARWEMRAEDGITWLNVATMGDRGASSARIDFSDDDLVDLIAAASMCLEAHRNFATFAGGPA